MRTNDQWAVIYFSTITSPANGLFYGTSSAATVGGKMRLGAVTGGTVAFICPPDTVIYMFALGAAGGVGVPGWDLPGHFGKPHGVLAAPTAFIPRLP